MKGTPQKTQKQPSLCRSVSDPHTKTEIVFQTDFLTLHKWHGLVCVTPVHVHTGGVGGGLQASSSTVRRDFLRQSLTEHGDHSFGETCCLSNPRDPSLPASPGLEYRCWPHTMAPGCFMWVLGIEFKTSSSLGQDFFD